MGKAGKKYLKGDLGIWFIFLLLCIISVIEVFSASSRLTFGKESYWAPILNHCLHLTLGSIIVYFVHLIPYRYYRVIPFFLVPISAVMLLYLFIKGLGNSTASRWIDLGFINFQPSELAKMAVVTSVAAMLAEMGNDKLSQNRTFWRIIALTAGFGVFIMVENLSTALLLSLVVFLMMYIGRVPWKKLLLLFFTVVGGGIIIIAFMLFIPPEKMQNLSLPSRFPTWQARVVDYFEHDKKISPREYALTVAREKPQETHANIAIATSNIFGKFPGNSDERDFVQEASCDFIYAIIIEELGLVGGVAVLLFYISIIIRVGRIARRCKTRFSAYLLMGVAMLIGTQALMNMAVAVGLMPVTGQPLPLISKGGTSILINCVYIGIILGVSRGLDAEESKKELETETNKVSDI
ncbi:MAG TPA: FtsW/RodA/SpoVE family cell cycle protein [Bacteroidaceae bacterium]|nr:FtsW/RodA/SpoVE family cell cycle protein [Bacteroidaceae bacterium]